ncbi:MAG: RluA family pseudouridine synthase [Gammaproteobacteria bacterium]|nr:RluA family pseudouridine synthase [Gammaproteobacteria bacterium]
MLDIYNPPVNNGLDIIYQDDAILVLNKPSGLLSVPGRGEEKRDSLATRVQAEYADALIVHRLDMSTSGLMVMARNKQVHRQMSLLFQEKQVYKKYIAVADGIIETPLGEIDLPLLTDWPNRPKQKVDYELGKPSLTRFRVLEKNSSAQWTRVELEPETGRTHQLRVHLLSIGHPILGDMLYGNENVIKKSKRLLLHAALLSFIHPLTKEQMMFESDIPF